MDRQAGDIEPRNDPQEAVREEERGAFLETRNKAYDAWAGSIEGGHIELEGGDAALVGTGTAGGSAPVMGKGVATRRDDLESGGYI